MKYLYLISSCFLFNILIAHSQQLRFSHYDVNDGLSQGNITCFMQDHLGLMWFGTWDGLNVYDGFKNKIYRERSSQPNSIKGILINDIVELPSKHIAIATYTGLNIYYREKDSFAFFKFKTGRNNTRILDFKDNKLYLLINNQSVHFDLHQLKFEDDHSSFSSKWQLINSTRKNGVNRSEFLFKRLFPLIEKELIPIQLIQQLLSTHTVNDIIYDNTTNTIYLACDEGFFTYNLVQHSLSPKLLDGPVKSLIQYKHQIYIGTQHHGLYRYNQHSTKIDAHFAYDEFSRKSISGNFIRTMFIDRKQNLWISVLGSGVNYANLNAQPCSTLLTYENFPIKEKQNSYIHAIAEDYQGNLWVATVTGNLFVLDNDYNIIQKFTPNQINTAFNSILIQQIFIDNDNSVFLLTEKGLLISTNHKTFTYYTLPNASNNQQYMQSIARLNDSLFLIGTREGILRFNKQTKKINSEEEMKDNTIHTIFSSPNGQIYINPFFNGFSVYTYQANKLKKQIQLEGDFNLKHAYYRNDTALFATTNGILCLNTSTFKHKFLDEDNGIPNQNMYCLLPDQSDMNTFWSSSNRGIFKYNIKTERANWFGLNDGLASLEFNTYANTQRKSGDYVFGSIDGLTYIKPTSARNNNLIYPPIITNFEVDHKLPYHFNQHNSQDELIIPFKHNTFSCRLIQIDYPNTSKPIKYKLTGYDKEWIVATNPIEIHYSNINEGSYQLLAQYLDQEKGWQTTTFYTITILSPWYRTWWAYLLYIVSISSVLFIIVNLYLRKKMQEKNEAQRSSELLLKERDRISADLHDDIGSTLSSIAIYNELISDKVKTKPELVPQLSEKISVQISNLMRHTEDIIWSLKIGQHQHETISKRIQEYATELLHSKQIQSSIDIHPDVENMLQHPEQRRSMLMIIKEAMNNCRKYSEAKNFTIHMFIQKDRLFLNMSDNGIGFDLNNTSMGDGIANIQNRCKNLNGTCEIISSIGKGTAIHCDMPISSYKK